MELNFWKKKPRLPKVKPEHRIIEAFEVKGVKYFRFDCEVGNMPYQRGLEALVFYEQVRMRCTREYLQEHIKALDTLLRSSKIDIYKINQLNRNLNDRVNWVVESDSLYNLASVVFFDATESPYHFDHDYNKKKVEKWKQYGNELNDFFLQKPLETFIPFLATSNENLQPYLKVVEELNREQMKLIRAILSTRE
jgi:hypothetical protein